MKTIVALPLLALGLAACQTYPSDAGYPGRQGNYRAIGTEPFWDLTIGRELVFTDRGTNLAVTEPTPPVRSGFAGETYQGRRINVNIVHSRCSDGMSDRTYPDTVNVTVEGRPYRGCGADSAFFAQVGETGAAQGLAVNIVGTWTAVAINGRRAGAADRFPMTVTPTRIEAHLCNDVRGDYRIVRSQLVPLGPPWPRTERGCYDPAGLRDPMALEERAWAVFGGSPTISMQTVNQLRLETQRGSIDFERAR